MNYPVYILVNVRQNLGVESNDDSQDGRIGAMSKDEILDRWLTWQGLINYGSAIRQAIRDIYGVELK